MKTFFEEADLEARTAGSSNAVVHIYNDLHNKVSDEIAKTGWLKKGEA